MIISIDIWDSNTQSWIPLTPRTKTQQERERVHQEFLALHDLALQELTMA